MYIFTIKTNKKEYECYNGKSCWIHNATRSDGFIEVYVLETKEYILVHPSELED